MEAIIKCNSEEIVKIEEKVLEAFKKQFPGDVYYTTFITKWNDGTFRVEVRHGSDGNIDSFNWDNGVEYWERIHDAITMDWKGNPKKIEPKGECGG